MCDIEESDDKYHHAEITVTILDTKTGNRGRVSGWSHWWWFKGNGSCDYNRGLMLERAGVEVPYTEDEAGDDCDASGLPLGGTCEGCHRFLIVEAPSDFYSLRKFNQGYPAGLLAAHGI